MHRATAKLIVYMLAVLTISAACVADESAKPDEDAAVAESPKVTITADKSDVVKVLENIAEQSGEKIVVESTVKGKVTFTAQDLSLEAALGALANAGNFEWRKVYVPVDSELLKKPGRFASTVRLMSGMSFPDLVIAGASTNKVGVHCENPEAVKAAEKLATEHVRMSRVYLITNDAAVAAKALAEKKEEDKAESDKVANYTNASREQMEMFMEMTPEEQEEALLDALNLMDDAGPEYMSSIMQAMLNADPDTLRRRVERQSQMLFDMTTDQRRAIMRMNMESMKYITPEQMQMLQEDAKAIAQEMQNQPAE